MNNILFLFSNDPWGPTTALMSEIADLTHNAMSFTEIMSMLWKRLSKFFTFKSPTFFR